MGFFDFGTIFFLVAAVVIFFQLRNVLGRRTGNERQPFDPYTAARAREKEAAATGKWDRDLDLDRDAMESWGAAAVVTLVEDHELESLQVAGLGAAVADRHMAWYHLPIRDVGIPSEQFEIEWRTVGEQLREDGQAADHHGIHQADAAESRAEQAAKQVERRGFPRPLQGAHRI